MKPAGRPAPGWRRADKAGRRRHVSRRPEQELQIAVIDYLRLALPGAITLHCPLGGKRGAIEGKIFKAMGARAGTPDILICGGIFAKPDADPGCWWIELKAKAGRLSDSQKEFRDECATKGIAWGEARSLDDVERLIRGWGFRPSASVLGLPVERLGRLARAAGPGGPALPAGGQPVPGLPGTAAGPGGPAAVGAWPLTTGEPAQPGGPLRPMGSCRHGVPYRWPCEECNEEAANWVYSPDVEEDNQPKKREEENE